MVAGDAGVGYLVNAEGSADMGFVIVNGDSAHRRVIANPAEGLAAIGDHFLTASGAPDGTSAWTSSCGGGTYIRNLQSGVTRQVPVGGQEQLSLGEGTLTWSYENGPAMVMDLTKGYLAPVRLSGQSGLTTVDDHLVAREIKDELWSPTPRMEMAPLAAQLDRLEELGAAQEKLGASESDVLHHIELNAQFHGLNVSSEVSLSEADRHGKYSLYVVVTGRPSQE